MRDHILKPPPPIESPTPSPAGGAESSIALVMAESLTPAPSAPERGLRPAPPSPPRDFSRSQLLLMRRTIARACTDAEFDLFIAVALQTGLDPLRQQIAPLIVDAQSEEKRRLLPWTTIDGLRVIAARSGDYRPMDVPPIIETDPGRQDEHTNPLGLTRAEVRCWKGAAGDWHAVAGEAWWDEYAPSKEVAELDEQGRRRPTGRMMLDASWRRMGRVMLAKCAEAQALRRGWPDLLAGLYSDDELHAARLSENTASEILKAHDRDEAERRGLGKRCLWFVFDGGGLEAIERDSVAARLRAFYDSVTEVGTIEGFHERNRQSLQIFWDWSPHEALALKQEAEARAIALTLMHVTQHTDGKRRSSHPRAKRRRTTETEH